MTPDSFSLQFGPGLVENDDSVRVICEIDVDDGKQPALARWLGPQAGWTFFPMQWMPVRLAQLELPQPCVFALGGDGTVGLGYGGYSEESINTTDTGPRGRGPLRALRAIAGRLYAAGMGRQVYRRVDAGVWEVLDPPKVPAPGEIDICGFTSIDGVDEDEIWAVGYRGEIWRASGLQWSQMPSPTNVTLHVVRAFSRHLVFAAGKMGLVLGFLDDAWRVLAHIPGGEDIWDLEWFGGQLFAATSTRLFKLLPDATFEEVAVPGLTSFGYLHANDGVLWSFGTLQLAWTTDAVVWTAQTPTL